MTMDDNKGKNMKDRIITVGLAIAFIATVWLSNWTLETYGVISVLGVEFASGVLWVGVAFGLRDALHETAGRWWVAGCIVIGAALSWVLSDGATIPGGVTSIAVASGAAFLLSETADACIYDPLRHRHWQLAVIASNAVGAVVDSALFLWLAFGSLDFLAGQVAAKVAMIALALPIVWWVRNRRTR